VQTYGPGVDQVQRAAEPTLHQPEQGGQAVGQDGDRDGDVEDLPWKTKMKVEKYNKIFIKMQKNKNCSKISQNIIPEIFEKQKISKIDKNPKKNQRYP
jgi:hypothetical protein